MMDGLGLVLMALAWTGSFFGHRLQDKASRA
jgi:hypothetical protein